MGANKFVLKHENIEVDYTLSGSVDNLALNYRDAAAGTIPSAHRRSRPRRRH